MKTRTDIHAGQQPKWEAKFYQCLQETADINTKIQALEGRLYPPVPLQTTTPSSSYYPVQPAFPAYTPPAATTAGVTYGGGFVNNLFYPDKSGVCT